ncbi:MAG: hypothetical protein QOJ84_1196 [Bradyrhizobium sp.]|nr:hypothetical protein [Bradyrhizobium sp.]
MMGDTPRTEHGGRNRPPSVIPMISQEAANRLMSSIDGALSRNIAPMLAMTSAASIATTAIRLPDMTNTPAMRMIAKKNSNA